MEINRKEIYRYLGYGRNEADETVTTLVEECLSELMKAAAPKSVTCEFPLRLLPENMIDFGCFQTCSENLYRNLQDCELVILFAATLGSETDVLIRRYNRIQMSKAVILQAAAAAMVEEYCDEVNAALKEKYKSRGFWLRPRFSPGYGDFSLETQVPVLTALEAGKRIGITLTDSLLMAPSKSVTAVIGAGRKQQCCELKGCEVCEKTDCEYRRGSL